MSESSREFPVNARRPSEMPRAYHPREKLFSHGASHLTQGELLTLLLAPGERGRAKAEGLFRRHGLSGVADLSPAAWRRNGLGQASAARMCAVFELARRAYAPRSEECRPTLSSPQQVFHQVRHLARARKEHLVGLYLDAQNGLVHRETLSIGSLNTTRTHPPSTRPSMRMAMPTKVATVVQRYSMARFSNGL